MGKLLDYMAERLFPYLDAVNYAITEPFIRAKRTAFNSVIRNQYKSLPRFTYAGEKHTMSIMHPYLMDRVLSGHLCVWENIEPTIVLTPLFHSRFRYFYKNEKGVYVSRDRPLMTLDTNENLTPGEIFKTFDTTTQRFLYLEAIPSAIEFYQRNIDKMLSLENGKTKKVEETEEPQYSSQSEPSFIKRFNLY